MAFANMEDIKFEGNLSDDFVEKHRDLIERRMQQIESRIRQLRPWLPDGHYYAKMAVIYGTLAYLEHHGLMSTSVGRTLQNVEEIKEGDITIKRTKTEAEREAAAAAFDYAQLFRKYWAKVIGVRAFTAGTTFEMRDGTKRRVGLSWREFWSEQSE